MYIIYGKDNCVWCDRAKELLDGVYIFKNVMTSEMHRDEFLEGFPGAKSVPKIIWITDKGTTIKKFESYEQLKAHFTPF